MTGQITTGIRNSGEGAADDPRWLSIVSRDKAADGRFWYSVATTGIYCRPSCPSRGCNPRNVAIHDTLAAAKATGFRACLRCKPDGALDDGALTIVKAACAFIDACEAPPTLIETAARVGLSPSHFHRLFKKSTGLTPRAFALAKRGERLRDRLQAGDAVADAIYDAGFNSSGRFYEAADALLGMTPTRYRAGGDQERLRFAVGRCSLGAVLVASSDKGVAAILLGDQPLPLLHDLEDRFPNAELIGGDAGYEALVAAVVAMVERPSLGSDLPLDIRGTAFQQRVWQALRLIPPGKTLSYSAVAQAIGAPTAVRAVARACAANALAVAIPCHRVVSRTGAGSGYRWGLERKQRLLDREAAELAGDRRLSGTIAAGNADPKGPANG